MFLQHNPLPVDIMSLPESEIIATQAGVVPSVAVLCKKEGPQDAVDFLSGCLNETAMLFSILVDNQENIDFQANLERNGNGRIGGIAEFSGQRTSVGKVDFVPAGAVSSNFIHV